MGAPGDNIVPKKAAQTPGLAALHPAEAWIVTGLCCYDCLEASICFSVDNHCKQYCTDTVHRMQAAE